MTPWLCHLTASRSYNLYVCVSFTSLWFLSTVQKHKCLGGIGDLKRVLGMSARMNVVWVCLDLCSSLALGSMWIIRTIRMTLLIPQREMNVSGSSSIICKIQEDNLLNLFSLHWLKRWFLSRERNHPPPLCFSPLKCFEEDDPSCSKWLQHNVKI